MRVAIPEIDVAILTADRGPVNSAVVDALNQQVAVKLRVHRVIGEPQPNDRSRREVICRARNEALDRIQGRWLMFVDDDVVLGPDCIAQLHSGLIHWPKFGALAADYRNDCATRRQSRHVAMGATLFRRGWLPDQCFRWEKDRCECLCRCFDMRRAGQRIEYLRSATALHLDRSLPRVIP